MGSQFSIIGYLNKDLREQNELDVQDNSVLRASGMGTCFRQRWYKLRDFEGIDLDDRSLRVFAVGHKVHEFIQDSIQRQGAMVAKEGTVVTKGKIKGHFDALIAPMGLADLPEGSDGSDMILYDIKTQHSKAFHYMKTQDVKINHKMQLWTYCKGIRENGYILYFKDGVQVSHPGEGVEERKFPPLPGLVDCRMLYVSKDDLVLEEKPIPYTPESERLVMAEIAKLDLLMPQETEPEPVPMQDWECKYCPFRLICPTGQKVIATEVKSIKL